jgi:hypothetical protein
MYTHTFEIEAVDVGRLEGEISFNGPNNQPPKVKFSSGPEMEVKEYAGVGNLFHAFIDFFREAGEIEKIEILKKP